MVQEILTVAPTYIEGLTRFIVNCSGEEVGPLQWKRPPVQLASKSAEPGGQVGKRPLSDEETLHAHACNEEVQPISNPCVHQLQSFLGLLNPPNNYQVHFDP